MQDCLIASLLFTACDQFSVKGPILARRPTKTVPSREPTTSTTTSSSSTRTSAMKTTAKMETTSQKLNVPNSTEGHGLDLKSAGKTGEDKVSTEKKHLHAWGQRPKGQSQQQQQHRQQTLQQQPQQQTPSPRGRERQQQKTLLLQGKQQQQQEHLLQQQSERPPMRTINVQGWHSELHQRPTSKLPQQHLHQQQRKAPKQLVRLQQQRVQQQPGQPQQPQSQRQQQPDLGSSLDFSRLPPREIKLKTLSDGRTVVANPAEVPPEVIQQLKDENIISQ